MKELITYFYKKSLVANVIFIAFFVLGYFSWKMISKEELPEFESNWIRVVTSFPGASAEDVELFLTRPLEKEIKSVTGIETIKTISTQGSSLLQITIDDKYPDIKEVVQNIREATLKIKFPEQVREYPVIRQFKSSEKAILDIGLFLKDKKDLDTESRIKLQKIVLNFENQIRNLKEVSSVEKSHYLNPVLNILVSTEKLASKETSIEKILGQIRENHIRAPLGALYDKGESRITLLNELEDVKSLNDILIQGNYEGYGLKLNEFTTEIKNDFQRSNSIFKINGHEGIFLNIKKSTSTDILNAQKKIIEFIDNFKLMNRDFPLEIILMDDESYAVRNRLEIILYNGIVGFILIVLVLFAFLDFKTGIWVAMGIPFSIAFTLIFALIAGLSVNNMTLAGIIIVLGIVVDDAIIIAENIYRLRKNGYSLQEACVSGVLEVFKPIFASIITTCLAFVPLMFFDGFFGKLITYIPWIVILMLSGSLLESIFILPSHLGGGKTQDLSFKDKFSKFENKYKSFLLMILNNRSWALFIFFIILIGAIHIYHKNMKFVMFPREESQEVFIKIKTPKEANRFETSGMIYPLEKFIANDIENVVGVTSTIGLSRRGGEIKENEASILVELKNLNVRKLSTSDLISKWEEFSKSISSLESVTFQKGRWGHSSGNSIEILIQENDDDLRLKIANEISNIMIQKYGLIDVEIENSIHKKEFKLNIIQENCIRYNVSPASVVTTLRSFVEGVVLYSILNNDDEQVDVVLSVPLELKNNINELLKLKIENKESKLVSIKNLIEIKELESPVNITRTDYKRSSMIYANVDKKSKLTPLIFADEIEKNDFPNFIKNGSTNIKFLGEIQDSREGEGEFKKSILIVIIMIFLVLVLMFNSLIKPILIISIVPFGIAGVIYTLMFHNMFVYGFFAVIGTIGMIGVVINDAIVMIDKIENSHDELTMQTLIEIVATRLRPILLTTITTVVGVLPTAYGVAGNDSMLSEMMLAMGYGLAFGTFITLIYIPVVYSFFVKRA